MTEIAINTLVFHGYSLDTALEEIARLSEYVEPVFIAKYNPSLCEEYVNTNKARMLAKRLKELRLKIISMGAHMNLGEAGSPAVFRRRMEFAKAIGARTVITNASRKSQETVFYRNMEKLAVHAEKLDIVIALENPGDGQDQLMGSGIEGIVILERLGSDRVKLNYDFSNVFTCSKGKKRPEQELEAVLPHIGHLHLKNVKPRGEAWPVCAIDEGIIGYKNLFQRFPALLNIPMSIELPLRFGYDAQFNFVLRETSAPPSLEHIRKVLTVSLEYLSMITS